MSATPAARIIAGRYQVIRRLGAGAFGEVFEVNDLFMSQVCALKFLRPGSVSSVWTEAQVLRQLEGEYILPVRNADWASGVPYIVTDVANNGTLTARIPAEIGVEISTCLLYTSPRPRD